MKMRFPWDCLRYMVYAGSTFIRNTHRRYRKITISVTNRLEFVVRLHPARHVAARIILRQYAPDGEWIQSAGFDIPVLPLRREQEEQLRSYLVKSLDERYRQQVLEKIRAELEKI